MVLLLLLTSSCILLLYYYWRLHTYWIRKNVPSPTLSFFNNSRNASLLKITVAESIQTIYKKYKEYPFVGIYELTTPVLLLRDPKLIKRVFVQDYAYFQSRGLATNEHNESLETNILTISGERWRKLRTKLTPSFTTNKIRHLFKLITEVSEELKQFIDQYADNKEPIEIQNLTGKFTHEIIATCLFGLKTNTIQNGDTEFRKMCKKIGSPSLKMAIKRYLRDYMPILINLKWIAVIPQDVSTYLIRIVKEIITYRETSNVTRNDVMQNLINLKHEKTNMEDEIAQSQDMISESNDIVIDDKFIAAQTFVFFTAGVDTTAATVAFLMYELAANPKIQERLYDEIRTYKTNAYISYDTLFEMKYLDCIVHETLRKYPPISTIQRICEKSYKIPNSDVILEKGTKVILPIQAIHHDPLYYKNPNIFDPDRFINENKKLCDNDTYLPFGGGPRICIAVKFAYIEIKACVVTLIANFKVELSEKTDSPLQFEPSSPFVLATKSGIWLKFQRRLPRNNL